MSKDMETLQTTADVGTKIKHHLYGTEATIVDSFRAGFVVKVKGEEIIRGLKWRDVDQWNVI